MHDLDRAQRTLLAAASEWWLAHGMHAAPLLVSPAIKHTYTRMLTTILFWVIFGALAGWIASALTGNDGRVSGWMNILVGILGAAIGGLIFRAFGGNGVTGFNLYSLLVAVIGAIVFLWIVNAVNGRARVPR